MRAEMASTRPWGYAWRSSSAFIIFTAVLGLFTETFLYGFIVPILSYMIEVRLQLPSSQTQWLTSALLTTHGLVAVAFAPIIAHFADKTPNRRIPLLLALIGCFIGTLLVALCSSVWELFLGRIIQAVSGSASWIIAFATLTDNISKDHVGKALGTAMSFVTAGTVLGPAGAGTLLQLLGYWPTWSAPLGLLVIGIISRLIMLERHQTHLAPAEPASDGEEAALLRPNAHHDGYDSTERDSKSTSQGFYCTLLSNVRVIAGLLNTIMFSIVLSGFDATLPLHLQRTFHWNILLVGMVFLGLQVPGMILGPLVGWLRDRVGLRIPTTIGWVLIALILCLLGVPGSNIRWIDQRVNGEVVFMVGIIGIGSVSPLVRGAGTFQLVAVTNDLKAENPTVFGPHGGSSRIFSITEVAFNVGLMLGPLIAGSLVTVFGFTIMVITLGVMSLAVAVSSFIFLTRESPKRP